MTNRQPIQHQALDAKIIAELSRHQIRFEDTPDCIRDVAIVGGMLTGTELYIADQKRIIDILTQFSKADMPTHPQCRFWIYSLDLSSDFLSAATASADERRTLHPPKIDLVISSFIFDGIPFATKSVAAVSPHHFLKNVWAQSATNLGARFAVTCGGTNEVHIGHFSEQGDYVQIVPFEPISLTTVMLDNHDYYSFLVHKNHLAAAAKLGAPRDPSLPIPLTRAATYGIYTI